MPHSSGGGSHRSGSHHSHSSHSSHRGGSSTPSRRVRRNNFAGSTRYVYYEKNKPVFVYANYDITQKRSSFRYLILLFYIPFILALIPMFKSAVHHPVKPLSPTTRAPSSKSASTSPPPTDASTAGRSSKMQPDSVSDLIAVLCRSIQFI